MGLEIDLDDSGEMRVHIPGTERGRGHDVYIPISVEGTRVLKKLLMERKQDVQHMLGSPGAPTQHQIKMWLAKEKEAMPKGKPPVKEQVKAKIAAKLDLNLDDLEINI